MKIYEMIKGDQRGSNSEESEDDHKRRDEHHDLDFENFQSFSAFSEVPYPDFLRLRNHAVPRANVLSKMQRITMRLLPLSKTYDCECNICLPHLRYGYGNECLMFGL